MTGRRPGADPAADTRELALESHVPDGPPAYRFETADGVDSPDAFRASDLALLEALWGRDLGEVRCLEANYGVVGVVLAAVVDAVELVESSARAARLCRRNARLNGVDLEVSLDPGLSSETLAAVDDALECKREPDRLESRSDESPLERPVDATVYAPKPYAPLSIASQRIADGLAATRPGGRFYLAASKRTGLSRYERVLADLADDVRRIAARDGVHVLEARRPETVERPTFVEPTVRESTVDGTALSLVTLPGLFAASGLDDGTRLLLESRSFEDGERVLDACCGYGPIGAYAAATADCEAWLTDDDALATRCARASCRATGVDVTVRTGDCVDGVGGASFDRVCCNPPTHAGSGVLADLFAGIRDVLEPGGDLTLVHHRDLDLERHLAGFEEPTLERAAGEHVVLRTSAR